MVTIAVDIEAWVSGMLVGGSRVYGDSLEQVRESRCPKVDGWHHFVDENTIAAKRGDKLYLFVAARD